MTRQADKPPLGRSSLWVLGSIVLVSGFCSLVYQMVWLRLLRLVFGASTLSSAAVLAIFMGGLGLGGLLFGRRVDRSPRPLTFYSRLELTIAATAALTPVLVVWIRAAYVSLGGTPQLGPLPGTLLRLVLSALVLGLPACLMGGTLPAVARALLRAERAGDQGRRGVGMLYGVNTLGAVLGTLWATFVAIEWLGLRTSIWVAALINLLLAICARALARSAGEELVPGTSEGGGDEPVEAGTASTAPASPPPAPTVRRVLVAAFVVGFVFFVMELVWYRMLAPLLGGSSYTLGLILATALTGIGAGGLIYGLGTRDRRPTLLGLSGTCALLALALILPFALGDHIAFLALATRDLGQAGLAGMVFAWSLVTALVVLPASLVAGYQFPLLVGLLGAGSHRVGREVGLAYLWNTLGAICGSVAGGFWLLPHLTAPSTWRLAALLLGLVAVEILRGHPRSAGEPATSLARRLVPAGMVLAVFALVVFVPGPSAAWRHTGIGAGRMAAPDGGPNQVRASFVRPRSQLRWEEEGVESSVALSAEQEYFFQINGKTDGSALNDAPTQVMSGLVGALLHPRPRSALVIGLGTGSSGGWLADVPGIERVDVVELEPAVARVARWMAPVNRHALDNPRLTLRFGDAREYLLTTRETYDVVFSEPSNPYRAGISSLFSRELYEAVARRLGPDGIFLQWLQGYEVDASVVRTAYATLLSVFPQVETWQVHSSDVLLVASARPLDHDADRIRRRAAQEPFATALELAWGVSGAEGLYSGFLAGPGLARQVAGQPGVEINTDDRPVIEFGFVRNLGRGGLFSLGQIEDLARRGGHERPALVRGTLDWQRVVSSKSARSLILGLETDAGGSAGEEDPDDPRVEARRAYLRKDFDQVATHWLAQPDQPKNRADRLMLAHSLARIDHPQAREHIDRLRVTRSLEADAALSLLHAVRREAEPALELFLSIFERCRSDPWIHPPLLGDVLRSATGLGRTSPEAGDRIFAALAEPFAVGLMEETRLRARLDLAVGERFEARCLPALEALEPHVFWELDVLSRRYRCYRLHRDPRAERALDDLAGFLATEPPPLLRRGGETQP